MVGDERSGYTSCGCDGTELKFHPGWRCRGKGWIE